MFIILLKEFWREIIIVLVSISLFSVWSIYSGMVEKRDQTIATLTAESKLNEIQKDTLRQAIIDQSEAVEKQRIDADKRAAKFELASKSIWDKYEVIKAKVQNLSGDEECQAMRSIVREAVK